MKKKKIVRKKNWAQDWLEAILFAFVVAMIIRNYTFQNFKIPTGSMESTLLVGDYLVANKMKYFFTDPKRDDIVTFRYPADPLHPPKENFVKIIPPIYWNKSKFFFHYHEKKNVVKRVIGMPGDKIEMIRKELYVNDEKYIGGYEQYLDPRIISQRDDYGPMTVPEGHYFVLGDNRDYSADSRYWGLLEREDITGSPLFIFWSTGYDGVRWERIFKSIK
ncbi:MAG: signal peptidase I [Candidatus Cloacimonas sp.]|nr:signal peptidase I [Candidatus Cloacimonadota bacterium]